MARALFLDRDGVINQDLGYVHRPDQVRFLPGIFELCRAARGAGLHLIVATNQSGIGRGLYSEAQFQALMDWMAARFAAEGAALDRVYHCPHHPEAGQGAYRRDCDFRKPKPGMLLQAAQDFDLDLAASALIGDQARDMAAARAAGLGCALLFDPQGSQSAVDCDRRCASLAEAEAALLSFAESEPKPL